MSAFPSQTALSMKGSPQAQSTRMARNEGPLFTAATPSLGRDQSWQQNVDAPIRSADPTGSPPLDGHEPGS
jgi:hypothetical protein